ncbi:sensor histidine kinase [Nonomuraea cavernae]|uniref:histidine kinase n=1 Tax=Nonomuraea cavernae TaxID=2045107 RepID=A0A917Z8E8_9ACTN|nr:histidine kinase [Nonomuraea cavernae]MCA2185635.1 histidine kinase [Nonomuraea cavernae]GGO78119.1 two-component sensor histidine kinase [Nonomuraea cavernae]
MSRLRRAFGALRSDLWTTAADPLPRMARPRRLSRLPHLLVILYALVMGMFSGGEGADSTVPLLAMIQAAILVIAMSRPLPAWWASIAVTVIGARTGMTYLSQSLSFPWMVDPGTPRGPVLPRLPDGDALAFPWTGSGIALQAGVLLLLALRVRPRVAASALAITTLVGAGCVVFVPEGNGGGEVLLAVAVEAVAVVIGAGMRALRTTRTRLEAQEELTAEERARSTLLEERARIARELHDVVAHHMSVISIQAQVAPHLVANPSDELKENLAGIRENAVEALTELRRVLGLLRAQDTPGDAPQPTLDRLGELLANVRGAGVALTAETVGEPRPLSPGVELSAFRIVQEALSNAMRHAPGAPVAVRLRYRSDALTIRVVNAAPAAPPVPIPGVGHGLLGMRERAAMLGGDLVTGPTPGGGYEVSVFLPIDSQKGIEATP